MAWEGKSLLEEGKSCVYGQESWVYGTPLVVMDVTCEVMTAAPGPDKEANWLPAPVGGEFNVVTRNYWPKEAALDVSHKNPPLNRVR